MYVNAVTGLSVLVLFLVLTTSMIAKGFRAFYHLLGIYHPTEDDLNKYIEENPDENTDDFITENWVEKFGLTFAINFISVMPILMLVITYGYFFLRRPLSYPAIFGTGIIILGVNTSLRIGEKFKTRWNIVQTGEQKLMDFGYSFFTSLWVLTIMGLAITILNGNINEVVDLVKNTNPGTPTEGAIWGVIFILFLIGIPFATELVLSRYVPINQKDIDFIKSDD